MKLFLALFVVTSIATGLMRVYAIRRSFLDVPVHRSSHSVPVPRGGGVAVVLVVTVWQLWTFFVDGQSWLPLGAIFAGVAVAIVGLVDDVVGMRALSRLAVHTLAAAVALVAFGGAGPLSLAGLAVEAMPFGNLLVIAGTVWLINLTNFMDGIDGIASVHVLTVSCGGAIAMWYVVGPHEIVAGALVLAACSAGFLLWNLPPARIFLGDVGSGYLGFAVAALAVAAGRVGQEFLWMWIILCGAFIVDATVTLAFRTFRGEHLFEAHRTHSYQLVAMRWKAHGPVTLLFGLVNILWLLPIGFGVALGRIDALSGMLVGWLPLVILAVWIQARAVSIGIHGRKNQIESIGQ